ncbi:hypothetical protein HNP68_001048 [Borrelia yangtzensis]|uniref:CobQ/CobB/MinD/ParA nucleotide binding domain protein n=1 Tax=Borreliella yangtzensis TaxID=683292 RepID=A0ABR6PB37_9SPIR|nr:hypothetical protein [Borreliella yangtzensis]
MQGNRPIIITMASLKGGVGKVFFVIFFEINYQQNKHYKKLTTYFSTLPFFIYKFGKLGYKIHSYIAR